MPRDIAAVFLDALEWIESRRNHPRDLVREGHAALAAHLLANGSRIVGRPREVDRDEIQRRLDRGDKPPAIAAEIGCSESLVRQIRAGTR